MTLDRSRPRDGDRKLDHYPVATIWATPAGCPRCVHLHSECGQLTKEPVVWGFDFEPVFDDDGKAPVVSIHWPPAED